MNKKYIGVFDSGIGGLTVVRNLIAQLPNENIVFLADTKNMPYGSRRRKQIVEFALNDVAILNRYDLKAILIACNTADSAARKILQKQSDIPVLGVIEAAARKACTVSRNKKIGVMATAATTRSKEYEIVIHSFDESVEVYSLACPELAVMIEKGKDGNDPEMNAILTEYTDILKLKGVDTIILGCTHYDVLKEKVEELLPETAVISSSACAIEDLNELLQKQDLLSDDPDPEKIYLVTADPQGFKKTASAILNNINIGMV
ncbi:MAG: glutamate racemase [Erysipelotrichaceae bacterium]|nr:glutamate racemase [Erysipelotrichaceae bacterium]